MTTDMVERWYLAVVDCKSYWCPARILTCFHTYLFVLCSSHDTPSILLYDLSLKAWIRLSRSAVNVKLSHLYISIEKTSALRLSYPGNSWATVVSRLPRSKKRRHSATPSFVDSCEQWLVTCTLVLGIENFRFTMHFFYCSFSFWWPVHDVRGNK